MKKIRINFFTVLLVATALFFSAAAEVSAATGRQMAENAIASLKSTAGVTTTRNVPSLYWSWFEINYYDETYPLTIDFVGSNFTTPKKIVYLFPGGGVNFRSSFFTPLEDNLAQYFRKAGYLVVGITPREDSVPSGAAMSALSGWGMSKHRTDIRKIVEIIQARLNLPYRIVGHSYGAAYALDYAASYSTLQPEKIVALDIYSFDPAADPQSVDDADNTCDAYQQLMDSGSYIDASYADIKDLMLVSLFLPLIDSGEPRDFLGLSGNFTYEGLLYFCMIYSSELPGVHSDITGLAGDWPLVQSYAAGQYYFASNPLFDDYELSCSDMCTLREASVKVGSGIVPNALARDFFAVNAFDSSVYGINWSAIKKPVLWFNTQYGYGGAMYGARLIQEAGNPNVMWAVAPGYGHLDMLAGRNAAQDVWRWLIQ